MCTEGGRWIVKAEKQKVRGIVAIDRLLLSIIFFHFRL